VVRPSLSDRNGKALFISTPTDPTSWFYDMYMKSQGRAGWGHHLYTTIEGGNVSAQEIEDAKRDMDVHTFRKEYEAKWESIAGRVYYAFEPSINVIRIPDFGLAKDEQVHIGIDFNVDPMSATCMVRRAERVIAFDEISIRNGNTEILAQTIAQRYGKSRVTVYPDPTGASRKTAAAAGDTDHVILRRAGFQVYSPGGPYAVTDKLNTVNRALMAADGKASLFFLEGKTHIIQRGLQGLTFVEGTSIPDPRSQYSHSCDSLAYAIMALLPIMGRVRRLDIEGV
jgi:hypothetical protein